MAKETAKETKGKSVKKESAKKTPTGTQPHKVTKPFRAIGSYFKGAWQELRLVRWPNRSATWGLTLAVVLFSLFFAGLILGLDTAFSYLFKEIIL